MKKPMKPMEVKAMMTEKPGKVKVAIKAKPMKKK